MTMRNRDSNIRRPMKPMWIPLWVACLLCGVVLFFLIGKELDRRREVESAWDDHTRVPLMTLQGMIESGPPQKRPAATPLLQAEQMFVDQFGTDTPDGVAALNRLANFWALQGDYTGAESAYREVIAVLTEHLGPGHPDVALVEQNILTMEALKTNKLPEATDTNAQPALEPPGAAPMEP